MMTNEASATLAKSSLVSTTSYLASLLVFGNCRITSIPLACLLDNLSVQSFHGAAPKPFALFVVNSTMKSTNA